jgi:hypothetical protein
LPSPYIFNSLCEEYRARVCVFLFSQQKYFSAPTAAHTGKIIQHSMARYTRAYGVVLFAGQLATKNIAPVGKITAYKKRTLTTAVNALHGLIQTPGYNANDVTAAADDDVIPRLSNCRAAV